MRTMELDRGHELRAVADRMAIDELVTRLGRWLDAGEFGLPHDVMAGDVTVSTPGGTAEGIEAVAAQAGRNHEAFRTQHVITDRLLDLDGDRATVSANLTVTFVPRSAGAGEAFAMGERYRFEAVRTAAGWRLSRIEVAPVWRARLA